MAGLVVTTTDTTVVGVSALPGATAEPAPTGPTGPGGGFGGGSGGGQQFQPPGGPQAGPGYSGGNIPAPPQGNGIDINNPPAAQAPEYSQAPQYPQQQTYPQRQQPVHGTQPPNYDAPLQQQPSQATQQPTAQPTEQVSATPEPSGQQQNQQPDQRQEQCQSAAAQLAAGRLPAGITGGGGRGLIWMGRPRQGNGPWKLEPGPTPDPSCPQCDTTAQRQPPPNDAQQQQLDNLQKELDAQRQQVDDLQKELEELKRQRVEEQQQEQKRREEEALQAAVDKQPNLGGLAVAIGLGCAGGGAAGFFVAGVGALPGCVVGAGLGGIGYMLSPIWG
ncbi:hypothetical protein ACTJJE_05000 [Mycolicibacterium sp. 22603]|uniref:hypothetical protein n=1 Tax=Mycolicibacterium sp. 22603 TaxID=3453950 RepID=UPI003F82E446